MTPAQFHARLLKLIEYAYRDKLCLACVLRELLAASKAIIAIEHLDAEALAAHSINNVVIIPGEGNAHMPTGTTRH
jgi:hypothetical protein